METGVEGQGVCAGAEHMVLSFRLAKVECKGANLQDEAGKGE